MSTVRVHPGDIEFDVLPGETIFDASFRAGWLWPTTCYGQAQCTRCHMKIVAGGEQLPAPDDRELVIIERLQRTMYRNDPQIPLRLACQARPTSDLEVELKQAPGRR